MSNDKVRSVELDQHQILVLLELCCRQMVRDKNYGYEDPILASVTLALIYTLAHKLEVNATERIPP